MSKCILHPTKDKDVWTTWFIEECERECLFGLNRPLLDRLYTYRLGAEVYLEDAPLFGIKGQRHRICGPYKVAEAILPSPDVQISWRDLRTGLPLVYREPEPQRGPWFGPRKVTRNIYGEEIRFDQLAHLYNFFPYRFRIVYADGWHEEVHPHRTNCPWCLAEE